MRSLGTLALFSTLAAGCATAPQPSTTPPVAEEGTWPAVFWGEQPVEITALRFAGNLLVVAGRSQAELLVGQSDTRVGAGPFVAALDDVGHVVWLQPIELPGDANIHALAPAGAGAVLLSGSVTTTDGRRDCVVGIVQPDGELPWLATIGGEGHAACARAAAGSDGSVRVAGTYDTAFSTLPAPVGMHDAMVLVLDARTGALRSGVGWGGTGDDAAYDLAIDPDGAMVVVGAIGAPPSGEATPIELTPEVKLTPGGARDGFVIAMDETGKAMWATTVAGPGDDVASSILRVADGWIVAGAQTRAPGATDAAAIVEAFLVSVQPGGATGWTWSDPHMARIHAIDMARDRIVVVGDHREGFDLGRGAWPVLGDTGITLALFSREGTIVGGYGCDGPGADHGLALTATVDGRIAFGGIVSPAGRCAGVPGSADAGFVRPMVLAESGELGAVLVAP
jgi:hypothetical protein